MAVKCGQHQGCAPLLIRDVDIHSFLDQFKNLLGETLRKAASLKASGLTEAV